MSRPNYLPVLGGGTPLGDANQRGALVLRHGHGPGALDYHRRDDPPVLWKQKQSVYF